MAGDALVAALPEVGGVHLLAASRCSPVPVPVEALTSVVEAARAGGWPVVVDLPRPGPEAELAEPVLSEADRAVLVVPARLRAASAARLLVDGPADGPASPWSVAQVVVRQVPGGLSSAEVAEVTGRPVAAELRHDRSVVPRGERGQLPAVTPRTPLGVLAPRLLAGLRERSR